VTEADPAQLLQREYFRERSGDQRKHRSLTAVKQQRLFGCDQELVEGEPGGRCDVRNMGRQAENAVGDLGNLRFHEITSWM
jgi:hypothetical protein